MKRKFDAKLRKVGNSYVVTIPKDTIDRFELKEGDFLAINLDINEFKKQINKRALFRKETSKSKDFESAQKFKRTERISDASERKN